MADRSHIERCFAVILAGGSGTRLWPLSRALFPKQLLPLQGALSLLQQTVQRATVLFPAERIRVVTNEEHRFEVASQLKILSEGPGEDRDQGGDKGLTMRVLTEPLARNTLPAILLGLDSILAEEPEPLVAVFPSDHHIPDIERWAKALLRGMELAAQGWFVTFGVTPTKPETGYGYIARGRDLDHEAFEAAGFVEKPDLKRAEAFCRDGSHFWNSGMFIFNAKAFLDAVRAFQPEIWEWWSTRESVGLTAGFRSLPEISVDYGIMEKAEPIAVVVGDFGWDDLGSWEAMHRLGVKDEQGCVIKGDVLAMDCDNCLLYSRDAKLAAVGLKNIIAVQTRDATLICSLDKVQQVKDVVGRLKSEGSSLVHAHATVRRPWGSYTVLEEGPFYKIKRIEVLPGAKLSLQMHHHRSEHWVVIKGAVEVVAGDKEILLVENQSVDIPQGAMHRLSNPGRIPAEIIEIQSGAYLEEDDIVRFEDVYGRGRQGGAGPA